MEYYGYVAVYGADDATLDGFTVTGGHPGMRNVDCTPRVSNCAFVRNGLIDDWYGGAMRNDHASPEITDCTFADNAASEGGAIWSEAGLPTLANCTFTGNTACDGGALFNVMSSPSITSCTFTGNTALEGGAIADFLESSPVLTKCAFTDNGAVTGGAISNYMFCSPSFTNCLFVRNTASLFGGAMWCYDMCSPSFTNCTFTKNTASGGGAVYDDALGEFTFSNCIFWADQPNEIDHDPWFPTTITVQYSCVEGGYEGEGNIDAAPLFVDTAGGNFRLDAASPCIDAGRLVADVTEDFEGDARGFDGTSEPRGDGSDYDMGADEFVPPHSADTDQDRCISVREISRVIAFYNAGAYHIDETTQDGYAPFDGPQDGAPHDSDYTPQDWAISIPEISRLVTFYNAGGYPDSSPV